VTPKPGTTFSDVLSADRKLVNAWLKDELRFDRAVPSKLSRAMRFAVMGPGKRIRAVLALETFRAARGGDDELVRPFCCGLEMVHAFSLVHDDLPSMDDDDERRGRPSLHRKYDESTAILAADALLARAFEVMARGEASAGRKLRAIEEVAGAIGPAGMAGGQLLDLAPKGNGNASALRRTHGMKTARFIAAAMAGGAMIAGARTRDTDRIRDAGMELGMLFQVTDDLLDAGHETGTSAVKVQGRERALKAAEECAHRAETGLWAMGAPYRLLAKAPLFILRRKR